MLLRLSSVIAGSLDFTSLMLRSTSVSFGASSGNVLHGSALTFPAIMCYHAGENNHMQLTAAKHHAYTLWVRKKHDSLYFCLTPLAILTNYDTWVIKNVPLCVWLYGNPGMSGTAFTIFVPVHTGVNTPSGFTSQLHRIACREILLHRVTP